jgi:hypothetical protein
MEHIHKNIEKFEKLYEIVLENRNCNLLTPKYLKNFKALIYLAGFIYNHFQLYKTEIYDEEILNYKKEIEKFHLDSIEDYKRIIYDNDIQEILISL